MTGRVIVLLSALLATTTARGDGDPMAELAELREALAGLRADYGQRIAALEARLAAAERRAERAEESAEAAVARAEEVAYAPQPAAPDSASAFNPALGAVLIGTLADVGLAEDEFAIPGFILGGETGPGADDLSLGESELNFNASIDDKFFGNLTFALADEEGEIAVELEEAWIQTLALPADFQLRAGRMFSGLGYLNQFHRHADDFIDRPLPYQAFLAGQYLDDGVQLKWLAPTPVFLELGAEVFRGASFPAAGAVDGAGAYSLFAKAGGDFGLSHSWKAGVSWLSADVEGRFAGEEEEEAALKSGEPAGGPAFFGDSDLLALEFVYKWAPNGNPTVRNFKLQGEYFDRDEDGIFDGLAYDGEQDGWYLQGLYQFRPGWRIGYRHDALEADNRGVAGTLLDDGGFEPERDSLLLEWSNSEFSRVLLQYTRDRSTPIDDDQLFLRYIMSIGAHRAHQF